jgi:general secretion pathway protein C
METPLRRLLSVVYLCAVVIVAALAGHAVAMLIGAALPRAEAAPRRARAPAPLLARPDKPIEAIVGRDVFCAGCDAAAPEPSAHAFTLLAIMFAPSPADARWSVAIVRDDESDATGAYGVGASLGGATIAAVEDVRVVLDLGRGRRRVLELLDGASEPSLVIGPSVEARDDGVRQTGPRSYEVRRGAIDRVLGGGVARSWPRVVPVERAGGPIGIRLAGVDRDGPLAAIGLLEGDVLLAVNGRSLATPDAALAAYTTLRAADHVRLAVDRGGRRVELDYLIR